MTRRTVKIDDNLNELDLMMQDMASAPREFRPTEHWQLIEPKTISWLRKNSLNNSRDLESREITGFGSGSHMTELSLFVNSINDSLCTKLTDKVLDALSRRLPKLLKYPSQLFLVEYEYRMRRIVTHLWKNLVSEMYPGKMPEISDSGLGNPFDIVTVNSKNITTSLIKHIERFLYVDSKIDLRSVNSVFELGSGSGMQVETNLKLSPHLKYVICDIPPPLYVAQQYLQAAFPGDVLAYSKSRGIKIFEGKEFEKYRIVCIAPWQLPSVKNSFDLFWTTSSFQEMETHIVKNYCEYVNKIICKWAYLLQKKEGQRQVKAESQIGGSLDPPTLEHYVKYLSNFDLIDISPGLRFPEPDKTPIHHMLFKKIVKAPE